MTRKGGALLLVSVACNVLLSVVDWIVTTTAGADLEGVTRVTSHPLPRQPISCHYNGCDLSYFDVVLCPSSSQFHSPVSPDPLNARSLRWLGLFP